MASISDTFEEIKHRLAIKNLERLADIEPPNKPPPSDQLDPDNPCNLSVQLLQQWTKDNLASIQFSLKQGVFGAKATINWKIA